MRSYIHIALHVAVPAAIAFLFYRERWRRTFFLLLAGIAIDIDHLLADPIYDPNRCSIGFHPLHTWPAVGGYSALLLFKSTRVPGIGLLIHIALDAVDCAWMYAA